MALTLYVARDRWRNHLAAVHDANPDLVPVAKGNGYGLGLRVLADEADAMGVDTLAVGQYDEVPAVADVFPGSLLVLTPWRPFHDVDLSDRRLVHTVGRLTDVHELAESGHRVRIVLEHRTSMLRHGLPAGEMAEALRVVADHDDLELEGLTVHLPLESGGNLDEARSILQGLDTSAVGGVVLVSHLGAEDIDTLSTAYPHLTIRPRLGTALWLGDRAALEVTAEVLDVHRVTQGQRFGYRGRTARADGTLLVVAGGSAHGIGMEAPVAATATKARIRAAGRALLGSVGYARSPYFVEGKQCLFAEPPHMQVSMILLPDDVAVPEVGGLVDVRVRFTTTHVDRVLFS